MTRGIIAALLAAGLAVLIAPYARADAMVNPTTAFCSHIACIWHKT